MRFRAWRSPPAGRRTARSRFAPHPVRSGAEETAQAQVRFDPAKEQFDFPAVPADQGDGQRIKQKLVSEKDEPKTGFRIDRAEAPHRLRITTLALGGIEPNGLVATQSGVRRHGAAGHLRLRLRHGARSLALSLRRVHPLVGFGDVDPLPSKRFCLLRQLAATDCASPSVCMMSRPATCTLLP